MTRPSWMAALAAGLVLAGCGGGGSGGDTPAAEPLRAVPASALVSPRAYTEFTGSLLPVDTETGLSVAGIEPPVTEREEPIAVR